MSTNADPVAAVAIPREVLDLCLTSLRFTRQAFETYPYPGDDIRAGRLADVDRAIDVIRRARKALR